MKIIAKILAFALAALLIIVALFVALNWATDKSVAELTPRWAPPPSQFISVDGVQAHVRDEGPKTDPTPIVLIHGTSASLHTWDGWADELKTSRRVIRFDLPAFGLTGPNPEADYRIERYVGFVAALLHQLDVERCVLVGNSLGGAIAWNTALAHPNLVTQLVLIDSGGYLVENSSLPLAFVISKIPVLNRFSEFTLPRSMVEKSVRSVYGNPDKVSDALVDRYYDLSLRAGNRKALGQRFAQIVYQDNGERIRAIKQPTLILWGKKDVLFPPELGEKFSRDIKNSEMVMFETLGHVPHEEDPSATVSAFKNFLEAHPL